MAPGRRSASRFDWRSALAGALITAIGLGLGLVIWRQPVPPPVVVHPPPAMPAAAQAVTPQAVPSLVTDVPASIMVFVSGAVQAPGVYTLDGDARVADALAAAGGLADDANAAAVNQAAPLRDGDQVHVPTQTEAPVAPPAGVSGAPAGAGEAGGAGATVNINTATQAELETLPGIGPARAQDIIANRPYASVDDLERVPGIGPATLEDLRPHVRVN